MVQDIGDSAHLSACVAVASEVIQRTRSIEKKNENLILDQSSVLAIIQW